MKTPPGSRLIAAIARLVPWTQRAEWVAEWQGELAYGYERARARGGPAWIARLRMRFRCGAALRDAIWVRRQHVSVSMLGSDVKSAFRAMRRRPAFAASIALTLSLGIGGSTAIFSVIDPLLFRPLPYPEADRLAEVHTVHPSGDSWAGLDVDVWRTLKAGLAPRVFDRFEAGAPHWFVVTNAGEPTEEFAYAVTPGALTLLGARPLLGRLFTETDVRPDAPLVVVLSETFWRRAFLSDRTVVGRTIALDGKSFEVIGVVPSSFKYPDGGVMMWVPLPTDRPIWKVNGFEAIGRLSAGVSREVAQSRVDALTKHRGDGQPMPYIWHLAVRPVENTVAKGVVSALGILAGAVACVLLIACVNAANLLLVHSTGRQTELAVRRSLGATSGRLFRQLVTETLLLSLTAGLLGVLIAFASVRAIVGLLPELLVRDTQVSIQVDGRVLGFSILLSLLVGVIFGAGPALRAARQTRLTGSDRTMTGSAAVRRVGGALVVVEMALSMMLLVGAGLLIRSFVGLLAVDNGFKPHGLSVLRINLPKNRYDSARAEQFYAELKDRLRALPGVQGVTVADGVPSLTSGYGSRLSLETETGEKRSIGTHRLPYAVVDDDYFSVLAIPIVQGRSFDAQDTRASPASAIIDPDLARLLWPDRSPLGRRFRARSEDPWVTVVGIVGDVKLLGPDDRTAPYTLYYSARQQTPWRYRTVAVRARGDPAALAEDIRSVVRAIDPIQHIHGIATAQSLIGESLSKQRFLLILMSVFTGLAVVLAAIGVYGVIAYVVSQRRREIGLRIALGATPHSMIRAVLAGGLGLALMGVTIGIAGALALSRFLTSMLFGVTPTDLPTLVLVAVVLTAVATFAALVPALRAGRTSPLQALRVD